MGAITRTVAVLVLAMGVAGAADVSQAAVPATQAAARAQRPMQVTVETRFLTVQAKDLPAEMLDPVKKEFRPGNLTAEQAKQLMRVAGGAVTAPRVTVFDGGTASVEVSTETKYTDIQATTRPDGTTEYNTRPGTTWDGLKMEVDAKVSKDRKYIRLKFHPILQKLLKIENAEFKPEGKDQRPIKFQQPMLQTIDLATDINVPDGQYLCLGGQTIAGEVEGKGGVESTLLVLVRAKIIAPGNQPEVKPK